MDFSIDESKENDLATRNIKTRRIGNLLFSLTLQAVRINNQGAPLLGLAKSIYYLRCYNDQKITPFFPSDFESVFAIHLAKV